MQNVIGTLVAVVTTLLLMVVAIEIGAQVWSGGKVQKQLAEIQQIHQVAVQLSATRNGFGAISPAMLSCSGMLPADITAGCDAPLTDQWGGTIGVVTGAGGQYLELSLSQIPQSACVQLAGKSLGASPAAPWDQTCVGSACTTAPSAAWANAQCGQLNSVSFMFGE